ncbi:MAG TPA: hypothetical protein VEH27_11435 [Methylomirabilota bacterium]|nr:hypothetical protein [Methylomirabilota bacterium]
MNQLFPLEVLRRGSKTATPRVVPLRAGPLVMEFESGGLRYIRYRDVELIRRVYAAVRDRNWGTVPARVEELDIQAVDRCFRVAFESVHQQGEIDFRWRGTITGSAEGIVDFHFHGLAHSEFLRNRIGFCVLHPADCAGRSCEALKVSGELGTGKFPLTIAPHCPFTDIKAFTHEPAPGVQVKVEYEGEIFEMEDQRNWLDASFKTYCTPLRLPFPALVRRGERVEQRVTVQLLGNPVEMEASTSAVQKCVVTIDPARVRTKFPNFGLGMASDGEPLTEKETELIGKLKPAHLRVEHTPSEARSEAALQQADHEALALGAGLEIALFLSDEVEHELQQVATTALKLRAPVRRWLVFHVREKVPPQGVVDLANAELRRISPDARIGSGTNAYFTELNRSNLDPAKLDFVCYSANPQVHAFDDASLMETLPMIRATAESAWQLSKGKPVCITPVTLKMRFNPDATGAVEPPRPGELPAPVDARQMSLFGAAWAVGAMKHALQAPIESVTWFETVGWRGLIEREKGSPEPALFPSAPGAVFPVFHVFRALAGAEAVLETNSSEPLKFEAAAVKVNGKTRTLIANLRNEAEVVEVQGIPSERVRLKTLDERTALGAMFDVDTFISNAGAGLQVEGGVARLHLLPYAVAQLDWD